MLAPVGKKRWNTRHQILISDVLKAQMTLAQICGNGNTSLQGYEILGSYSGSMKSDRKKKANETLSKSQDGFSMNVTCTFHYDCQQ